MRADTDLERFRRASPPAAGPLADLAGSPAMVGKVVSAAANIHVGSYLIVNPVEVYGADVEAGPGTLTVGTPTVPVLLLGPALPATGDLLVCRRVRYRWVAGFDGNPPGCKRYLIVFVRNCDGSCDAGAVATITSAGGFSGSCTIGGLPYCSCRVLIPDDADTYTVAVAGKSQTFAVPAATTHPCSNAVAAVCLGGPDSTGFPGAATVCVPVTGCNGRPMAGVTVSASQGGTVVGTGVTDSTGTACLCVPSVNLDTTFATTGVPSRYGAGCPVIVPAGTMRSWACVTQTLNPRGGFRPPQLIPASAFDCVCLCVTDPAAPAGSNLTLTDSVLGFTVPLANAATHFDPCQPGAGAWTGIHLGYSYPGCTTGYPDFLNCASASPVAVGYGFGLSVCGSGPSFSSRCGIGITVWNLFSVCPTRYVPPPVPFAPGVCFGNVPATLLALTCPPGFSATFKVRTVGTFLAGLYCDADTIITVFE